MLINDIPRIMVTCLLITIIIEVIFALLFKVRDKKDILNVILANIITNPVVVILPHYISFNYGFKLYDIVLLILEILAVIVEGFIYHKYLKYKKINPYLLSLLLNVLSYFIGDIYWRLVWKKVYRFYY